MKRIRDAVRGYGSVIIFCLVISVGNFDVFAVSLGDRVEANGTVNVRQTAAGSLLGTQASGSLGVVIGGPTTATLNGTSYTWYDVNFDTGVDGWVADSGSAIGLTVITPATPTSPSPGSSSPGPVESSSTVTLSWGASIGATYYDLGVVDVAAGTFVVNTTTTSASYTATLTAGKTYKWNVAAGDSAGESSFTTVLYFQTPASTPTISSVSPTSMPSSSADQSFIVYGNNFLSTSTLTFVDPQGDVYNSVAAKLTFVSSGQLDYQFNNGSDPGTWTVKVNNGGSSSGTASFTVTNVPATPSIASVSPTSMPSSSADQSFIVYGNNFLSTSTLTFVDPQGDVYNSVAAKLTFVSSGELDYQLNNGSDPGTWTVKVNNGGLSSATASFTVTNVPATPSITSVSPTSMPSSSADQSFIVYGNNFLSTSTLTFVDPQGDVYNSVAAKLTFVSSGQLDYQLNNGSDPGTWTVKVNNGSLSSGTASFTVTNGTSSTLQGIDYRDYGVSATTGVNIPGITNAGKQFVCEYIGTADNDGYLRPSDVMALTNQGLQIVSIFERTPTSASYFTMANADYDATVSINAAIEAGQPSGSAIYFTVDYQVSSADFSAIDSYFQEIRKDFNQYFAAHPGINYKIGVYAPGNVLPTLMGDASVGASYSWLAEPWGIYSYSSENLAQTQDGVMIGGINADLDEAYTADFGQWGTSSSPTAQPVFGGLSITGGQLQTTLSGLVSGQTVIVYGSTDLKNWTPVKTNTVTGSTMTFTNTINPAIQAEYFRAQAQQ